MTPTERLILLTNAVLRAAIARLGYLEPEPGRLHLFGLRGASPAGSDAVTLKGEILDRFDDVIGCFGTTLLILPGSVEPGRFYTDEPENPHGAAHLCDGCWSYMRGVHKGHAALVQAAPVEVQRDRNRNGFIDPGEPRERGWFGIDIHASTGGSGIGHWSAGCQIVQSSWNGDSWLKFKETVYGAPQEIFRYYLMDGKALLP